MYVCHHNLDLKDVCYSHVQKSNIHYLLFHCKVFTRTILCRKQAFLWKCYNHILPRFFHLGGMSSCRPLLQCFSGADSVGRSWRFSWTLLVLIWKVYTRNMSAQLFPFAKVWQLMMKGIKYTYNMHNMFNGTRHFSILELPQEKLHISTLHGYQV